MFAGPEPIWQVWKEFSFENVQRSIVVSIVTMLTFLAAELLSVSVGYLDNGRYSRVRGEVTVYDALTGKPVGYMAPDSGLGFFAGTHDLVNALNVTTQSTGHKIIFSEEDGAGKVIAYRWLPVTGKATVPAPTQFSFVSATDTLISLKWSGKSVSGYRVFYGKDSVSVNDTSVVISKLVPNTAYLFKLVAVGKDTVSDTVQVTAQTKQAVVVPVPVKLQAQTTTTTKTVLTWEAAAGARKYRVIQQLGTAKKTLITTTKLTYTITLVSGQTYLFWIEPVVATNNTAITNSKTVTVTAP